MRITALYLSDGHNFFGRYGHPSGDHPLREVAEAECVAGRGLRGDRFFDYKPDYKGQITFFAQEVYLEMCQSLNIWDSSPGVLRRNVVTEGLDLNHLIGAEFVLQNIRFYGASECSPCKWMNEAFSGGAAEFLRGRGGLRARILTDGVLRQGAV